MKTTPSNSQAITAAWHLETHRTAPDAVQVIFNGLWCIDQDLPSSEVLHAELTAEVHRLSFCTDGVETWDSGFLAFLATLQKFCVTHGIVMDERGLPEGVRHLLSMAFAVPERKASRAPGGRQTLFYQVGAATIKFCHDLPEMLRFLGEITLSFGRLFRGCAQFRLSDLWLEVEEVGPKALAIVSVICFLVGLILAYLGADQLRMVGAQLFIADLVAIGMVRGSAGRRL